MFPVPLVNVVAPEQSFPFLYNINFLSFWLSTRKGGKLAEENCKVQAREQMLNQLKISVDQAAWYYVSNYRNERLRNVGIKGAVK